MFSARRAPIFIPERVPDPRLDEDLPADGGAVPPSWTPDHVGLRLVEAFRTLDALPRMAGPRAAGNHWPRHAVEWSDLLAQAELPEAERREMAERRNALALRPDGAAIARMDRALDWLRALRASDPAATELLSLWALRAARGRSLRALCRERGWTPATFYRRRGEALASLATTLNRRAAPVF